MQRHETIVLPDRGLICAIFKDHASHLSSSRMFVAFGVVWCGAVFPHPNLLSILG